MKILNDVTGTDNEWLFDGNHCFKLKVYFSEQEPVISNVEELIDCRYTYELIDDYSFYIVITFSTLYQVLR